MSVQKTMEFAWESWESHFRERLIGLDNLARQVFYDLQQDRIPNAQIQQFIADRFAELWEKVAQEQEDRFGRYRFEKPQVRRETVHSDRRRNAVRG